MERNSLEKYDSKEPTMELHRLTDAAALWVEYEDEEEDEPYTVEWETGPLGLTFMANTIGNAIIRRVQRKGTARGLQYARTGDMLVAIDGASVTELPFVSIMEKLKCPTYPMRLEFVPVALATTNGREICEAMQTNDPRSTVTTIMEDTPSITAFEPLVPDLLSFHSRDESVTTDVQKSEEDFYDVVWDSGPFGCGLKRRHDLLVVKSVTGKAQCQSVLQIQSGDTLLMINGKSTADIGFKETLKLLQVEPKPVYMRFQRKRLQPHRERKKRLEVTEKMEDGKYTVIWREGPLGIQIKTSLEGNVFVSKFTGAQGQASAVSDQISIGDIFLKISTIDVKSIGIAAAFQLLRSVPKPVALVFMRPIVSEVERKYCNLDELSEVQIADEQIPPVQRSRPESNTRKSFGGFDRSANIEERKLSQHQSAVNVMKVVQLPQFSEIEVGKVKTKQLNTLPPPPAYNEMFTESGRPKINQVAFSHLPLNTSDLVCDDQKILDDAAQEDEKFRHMRLQFLAADRKRNARSESIVSTYSDIDDSGIVKAIAMQQRHDNPNAQKKEHPVITTLPEFYIQWQEGPLGITFKRAQGKIIVSRLTGAGYAKGIAQLHSGDWLVGINDIDTRRMKLSDTMQLLKLLEKPIKLCFVLQ